MAVSEAKRLRQLKDALIDTSRSAICVRSIRMPYQSPRPNTYTNCNMAGLTASVEGVSPAMVRLSPCVSEIVRPDGPLVA
jgi:hypothetical protein